MHYGSKLFLLQAIFLLHCKAIVVCPLEDYVAPSNRHLKIIFSSLYNKLIIKHVQYRHNFHEVNKLSRSTSAVVDEYMHTLLIGSLGLLRSSERL
jgi:hypothetical protein